MCGAWSGFVAKGRKIYGSAAERASERGQRATTLAAKETKETKKKKKKKKKTPRHQILSHTHTHRSSPSPPLYM
jgi:hypothetical protein